MISLDKIRIGEKVYYSAALFMLINGIKTRKTVYDWIDQGKAEKKKIGTNSFFTKL
jgi:hypothetical protein